MRLKRLLVSGICMVLGMCLIAGCAKEEDTVNQGVTETITSETTEVSEGINGETEIATTEAAEAIDPDDIKLRNIFMESFADSVTLPAEPGSDFCRCQRVYI